MQRRMLEPKWDEEGIHLDVVEDEGPDMGCLLCNVRDQAGYVDRQTTWEMSAVKAEESEPY